jgi:hypothetical protein
MPYGSLEMELSIARDTYLIVKEVTSDSSLAFID